MMDKRGVFDNDYYNLFMYVSISLVTMLILFNSANIIEQGANNEKADSLRKGFTGFAVSETEDTFENNPFEKVKEEALIPQPEVIEEIIEDQTSEPDNIPSETEEAELYSENSYLIYYTFIGFLGLCIFLLSSAFIIPRLKKYT